MTKDRNGKRKIHGLVYESKRILVGI